jgi:serine/threonine protein kinase
MQFQQTTLTPIDLQTLLDQSESTLSVETACSIATQVVDAYEYIHSKGYVHKDCKGSNILFVNRGSTAPEVTNHTPLI